ncbi:MAG: DUF998 domain-containing protein [Candidatus Helarchaeota archaeon]|nr:DUF998 domain-containing protein [Candidatus Helarchaeota archaeon]
MEKAKAETNWVERAYNKLTAPKTVKYSGLLVLVLYLGLVSIGVLVAAILGPSGYSVTTHYISALGSSDTTPVPILYDLACIFAGTLTIPLSLYLEKHIAPIPRKAEDLPAPHRWSYRLTGTGFFFSLLGSIFYIGVGIFSADRGEVRGIEMHNICSYATFGGFAFAALFLGFAIIFVRQPLIPKPYNYPLGIWGVVGPITVAILNLTGLEGVTYEFLEWFLLWAILAWLIPLAIFTLRHIERQLHNEK